MKKMKKFTALLLAAGIAFLAPADAIGSSQITAVAETVTATDSTDAITASERSDLKQVTFEELDDASAASLIQQSEDEDATGASSSTWDKYASDYAYTKMDSDQKALYNDLDSVCRKLLTGSANISVNSTYGVGISSAVEYVNLTVNEACMIAYIFMYENPQYYFLAPSISYSTAYSESTTTNYIYMTVNKSFCTGTARTKATSAVKSRLTSWNKSIAAQSTVVKKEKKAHDLIVDNTTYAANDYDQTVYSVLVTGKSVCAGYAQTFAMLCNYAGIDTMCVTSNEHEWNKIKLYGYWYNVDVTWDDPDYGSYIYYDYFNRSDSKLPNISSGDNGYHTMESYWSDFIPTCSKDSGGSATTALSASTSQTISASNVTKTYKNGATFKIGAKLTKGKGAITYTSSDKSVVTVGKTTGKVTIKGYGVSTITITAAQSGVYRKTTKKITVAVKPKTLSKFSSVSNSAKSAVTLKWTRDGRASGYQIQYSTKSSFSGAKSVRITSNSTVKTVLKGLTKGKKYYFRIRSYKNSNGTRVYGAWNTVASKKITK